MACDLFSVWQSATKIIIILLKEKKYIYIYVEALNVLYLIAQEKVIERGPKLSF